MDEDKYIYKELSYKIIGYLYDIHNEIGGGHKEKYIQRAVEVILINNKIDYKKELHCPLMFGNNIIGEYFFRLPNRK